MKPGREGAGGYVWDEQSDFPGVVGAPNLSPDPETGLGKWTDGEIIRAIREGVDRDGNALFPIMPYGQYRGMSDEDARSIVVFLRSLKPQQYAKPKKHLNPPLNFIEKFIPEPLTGPVAAPNVNDRVAYGKYLVTIAGCGECHTPKDDKGKPLPGMELAGGFDMRSQYFHAVSANITPHKSTYLGRATRAEFIARFKAFASVTAENAPKAPYERNTPMPWLAYSGITEEDLGSIYDYLQTVTPVEHVVNSFPDAK